MREIVGCVDLHSGQKGNQPQTLDEACPDVGMGRDFQVN